MKVESSFFSVFGFFILQSFLSFVKKRVSMYNKCNILTENLNKFLNEDFYFFGVRRCPFSCAI